MGEKDDNNQPPTEDLGLDDVLRALSLELDTARKETEANGGGYGLGVAQAEVELTLAVKRNIEGKTGAKVKFTVLPWLGAEANAEAKAGRTRTDTHRIKLTLTPVVQVTQVAAPGPFHIPSGGRPVAFRYDEHLGG